MVTYKYTAHKYRYFTEFIYNICNSLFISTIYIHNYGSVSIVLWEDDMNLIHAPIRFDMYKSTSEYVN